MEQVKRLLKSEKTMTVVNVLFIFSAMIRSNVLLCVAHGFWLLWLAYCIRNTDSKVCRICYLVMAICATVSIVLNLLSLFHVI